MCAVSPKENKITQMKLNPPKLVLDKIFAKSYMSDGITVGCKLGLGSS